MGVLDILVFIVLSFGWSQDRANDEYSSFASDGDHTYWGYDSVSLDDGRLYTNWDTIGLSEESHEVRENHSGLRISRYISYAEATRSATAVRYGIPNIPNARQIAVMQYAGRQFFDPVREHYDVPLYITSFYRAPRVNKLVGGADESHHTIPDVICAMDIDQDGRIGPTNTELFNHILAEGRFYTLIWEFGDQSPNWVHVAYSVQEPYNDERHVYRATKVGSRTVYTRF